MLVHLHRGDYVAADKCVRESYSIPGFSGSEDCVALEQLLQGYDEQDEEQVARVCNSPLFKYMDNDVSVKSAYLFKLPDIKLFNGWSFFLIGRKKVSGCAAVT